MDDEQPKTETLPVPLTSELETPVSIPNTTSRKKPKITLLLILAGTIFLLGAAAAAYTNFVVNTPEKIWESAMQNTSKGFQELSKLTQEEPAKGGKVTGSFTMKAPLAADGSVEGSWDENSGEFTVQIAASGVRVSSEIRLITEANITTTYVKLEGLESASALLSITQPELAPLLGELNGAWYAIDQTLLAEIVPNDTENILPNNEELRALTEKLTVILNERMFTTDQAKAVVIVKEPIGREDFEGKDTYKFNVTVQQAQLKEFTEALKEALKDTSLEDMLGQSSAVGDSAESLNIDQLVDESVTTYNAEVWVDMDMKYFRNIRITPVSADGVSEGSIDLGLNYEGGDVYPFSIRLKALETADSTDTLQAILSFTFNTSSKNLDFGFDVSGTMDEQEITASGKVSLTPSDDSVQVEKPTDAKNILELLGLALSADTPSFDSSTLDSLGSDIYQLDAVEL